MRPTTDTPKTRSDEGLALLAAAAGLVAGLLTAVAAAAETPPGAAHLDAARRELAEGRDARAVFHLRRHLDRHGDDVDARSVLAGAYARLGLEGPALRELHLVLAERPDQPEALHALGALGEPDDVARAIAWLLDPAQRWVTGQVLGIDGGLGAVLPRPRRSL